ncbi:MAG TPA: DUF418 domain-containing protein [Chitinophagaceae bacterium]|nr:DUF418 domain-containing protein [Chitinophagaceae bacterium]
MSSAPVQLNQRIQYLDVLRGIAISGVLFAFAFWNLGTAPKETWTSFEKILDEVGAFLIDSKCYTTLACLFAVGFVLHMDKTSEKARSLYTYRRRLLGLLIIGAFHALILRNGDILAPYAITSLIVTFFYRSSNRTLVIALVVVFLLQIFLPEIWLWSGFSFPKRPRIPETTYLADNFQWVKYWYATSVFFWETTVFLLLLGLLVGRAFIERKLKLSSRQLALIIIVGLAVGTGSYLLYIIYPEPLQNLPDLGKTYIIRSFAFSLFDLLHKIGMASAYASIVFLLLRRFSLSGFANLGRMSLTNYIIQAVIIIPVCIIFNLFDHVTPTIALVMTGVVWVFQIFFSNWWLSRHKFGPLEWLLRWFTYGRTMTVKKEKEQMELKDVPVMVRVP